MSITPRFGEGSRVLVSGGAGFVPSHLIDVLMSRGLPGGGDRQLPHRLGEQRRAPGRQSAVPPGQGRHLRRHPGRGRYGAALRRDPAHGLAGQPHRLRARFRWRSCGPVRWPPSTCSTGPARTRPASCSPPPRRPTATRWCTRSRKRYWGNVNPVGIRSVYDEAKRFAEAATMAYRRTYGVDTAIVRIFNTYGPRMRPNDGRAIPTFISQALRNEPITVARHRRADPIHLLRRRSGSAASCSCSTRTRPGRSTAAPSTR